jgi:hypothetical protein
MLPEEKLKPDKPKVLLLMGYYYLSNPIYEALKHQLKNCDVFYYNPKEYIGGEINSKNFNSHEFAKKEPGYSELSYDPPWYQKTSKDWVRRNVLDKLKGLFALLRSASGYKKQILAEIERISPDIVVCNSDIFIAPRMLQSQRPDIPLVVIQPCFLDLREEKSTIPWHKKIVNYLFGDIYATQGFWGMECQKAKVLVWDSFAFKHYQASNINVYQITNPADVMLKSQVAALQHLDKSSVAQKHGLSPRFRTVILYTGQFASLHGQLFQTLLETSYRVFIEAISPYFNVIVKIHPNDEVSYWESIFDENEKSNIKVIRDIDKAELLFLADIAISTDSYAAYEAAINNLVSINFNPKSDEDGYYLSSAYAKVPVLDADKISTVNDFVLSLLDDKHLIEYQVETKRKINALSVEEKTSLENLILSFL